MHSSETSTKEEKYNIGNKDDSHVQGKKDAPIGTDDQPLNHQPGHMKLARLPNKSD